MTYNLQNTVTAAFAAIISAAVFVGASVGPSVNTAASFVI